MNNLISIIVPAYNIAPWLSRCLDSILAQTYKNLEIIVIDDGSTDETSQIIDEYVKKDSRIVAIHQKNAGLVAVRNRGIEIAEGDWIGFVDGDDAIDPDMYARLLSNALKYDADISHCGVRFCFPDGHEELHYGTGEVILQNNFDGVKDLLEGTLIEPGVWNKLYRASLMADSCLDETILNNEDLLRNFVLFERAKQSVFEDFCGYQYYQREGSMSKDKSKALRIERHVTRARRLIVEHSTDDTYPYAMQTWLSSIVNAINTLTYSNEPEIKQYCQECREVLRKERSHLHYLIKRQQLAARLILLSPALHRMVYRIYSRDERKK